MIKMRYKDVSKYVIWPDCSLPEEYNQGFLTFNSDRSKRTAVRYNHAGNHQAAILRLKKEEPTTKDFTVRPFGSPRTFPRTKSQKNQPQYTIYPARALPTTSLATVEEEQQQQQKLSVPSSDPQTTSKTLAEIEDDRTPLPRRMINSVRRSESSDEDEPVVRLAASGFRDESGFVEDNDADGGGGSGGDKAAIPDEPDLQIWRL
ncbi:unnamed protein product [Gongylonema pulchrum]|uniref:Uncharacterized protein n=1 Tax=Gongylonema pulchrum TaxID=637853 RepID=A0A183D4L9_9BILA|nr:unnamed protein product [Gongylonema pulchrum]